MPTSSLAGAMLSQALTMAQCTCVAWSGPGGSEHYRMTTEFNTALAGLADLARDSFSLVQLSCGWWRAQQVESPAPEPLVAVVSELSPKLLESLSQQHRQGMQLLVILLDERRRYQSYWPWSQAYRGSLEAYCAKLGLAATPPTECLALADLQYWLDVCLSQPGVRLMHVLGPQSSAPAPQIGYRPFSWDDLPPADASSFEASALNRFSADLKQRPNILGLWTLKSHPGTLTQLGVRLQFCPLSGLFLQALGAIGHNLHPLVFVSALKLPKLLPDLLELGDIPLTLVILGAGAGESTSADTPAALQRDLALLRAVPDLTIAVPADEEEARSQLLTLLDLPSLSALRLTQAPALNVPSRQVESLPPGRGEMLREGADLALICLGPTLYPALLSAETLRSWGVQCAVYNMRYLRPLDEELLRRAAQSACLITVEDHSTEGGLGTAVAEELAEVPNTQAVALLKMGLDDNFSDDPLDDGNITIEGILKAAKTALKL